MNIGTMTAKTDPFPGLMSDLDSLAAQADKLRSMIEDLAGTLAPILCEEEKPSPDADYPDPMAPTRSRAQQTVEDIYGLLSRGGAAVMPLPPLDGLGPWVPAPGQPETVDHHAVSAAPMPRLGPLPGTLDWTASILGQMAYTHPADVDDEHHEEPWVIDRYTRYDDGPWFWFIPLLSSTFGFSALRHNVIAHGGSWPS